MSTNFLRPVEWGRPPRPPRPGMYRLLSKDFRLTRVSDDPEGWRCDIYDTENGNDHHGIAATPMGAAALAIEHWHRYEKRRAHKG